MNPEDVTPAAILRDGVRAKEASYRVASATLKAAVHLVKSATRALKELDGLGVDPAALRAQLLDLVEAMLAQHVKVNTAYLELMDAEADLRKVEK